MTERDNRPQLMHTFTFSATRKFLTLVAVMCLFSAFSTINAYAKDIVDEIFQQQEMIVKLNDQFITSQRRIASSDSTNAGQELALDQLGMVGNFLASTDREFTALAGYLDLTLLVTDQRLIPHARKIVDRQKLFMVKSMTNHSDFIEKMMPRIKDQETSRLVLEARDLLRASVVLVNHVQISGHMRK